MLSICRLGNRLRCTQIRCLSNHLNPKLFVRPEYTRLRTIQNFTACSPQIRSIHNSQSLGEDEKKKWSITMSDEQKKRKQEHIEKMNAEKVPEGMVAKVKYYLKRYWYIAVPAHMVTCTTYFGVFYAMVYCGVDVVSLLKTLHCPELLVQKIQNTPPSAGAFVIALILYKIATPARYLTTLGLIQAAFWGLRRMGKLRTVREVEFKARTEYERRGRRLYRDRNMGVRQIARKNSDAEAHRTAILKQAEKAQKKD